MNRRMHWVGMVVALALLFAPLSAPGAQAAPAAQDDDAAARIANAESAAPSVVGRDATILGYDDDGMPTIVLREGTNGWTCYEDWPATPGNDPSCLDAIFQAWNEAIMAGKEEPGELGTGIAYMLQGGSDPSNTDPFALEPAAGEDWITTPPHIMIITPVGFDAADYPAEPKQDEPYIMWDGTPYEHLMVPVVPTPDDLMGDVDAATANILRSAPAGIALNATIMGPGEKEGDPMVVVKEGTNGWVCYPDGAVSPGNDPSCNDPMMEAFWSTGDPEVVTRAGLSYMLQGGSDASNTDPNLFSPPEGEDWVTTAPHVMLEVPGGFDTTHFSTDHTSGFPYVMFADSDYQHLMIPIVDLPAMEHETAGSADIEQLKAEAIAQELGTFDLYINRDWEALDAVTGPDYFGVAVDGSYTERDAMLAGLQDEKLTVLPPDLGEIRVLMITPDAYMVTYPLNFNGTYDGKAFSNPRTVSSLWVKRDGKWQNIFLSEEERTGPLARSTAARIANAESAAPSVVGRDATILGYDEDGMPTVVLREGANGWTCYEDWPATPGNDPSCLDAVFQAWNEAIMAGKEEPGELGTGIAYMLQGGSDPSNTDPFAMEPAAGEDWITTPPHIMIITPAGFDAADYPAEPKQDEPYIMWDGTPYEHLMVPVVPTPDDLMGDVDAATANILRSAPAGIALNATIMGPGEKEGDPMVVVKEGTNGWVCYPDGAVSPGNDPSCNDYMMEAFWSTGDPEVVTRAGLSYMLQGGSDASNTDPNLFSPPEGEDWVTTAPHVMLEVPGGFDTTHFSTDHTSGFPYVMFADSDYQHLMIPIVDLPAMETGDTTGAAGLDALLAKLAEQTGFSGSVLVARDGSILLESGYGLADQESEIPNTPQTRFRLASITKQFTAAAVLLLQEQGKLSVDDLVCTYLPECPEGWQAITIHHLLTHTAGLFDFRDFAYQETANATPSTSAEVIEHVKAEPLGFTPGEEWGYSNGNFMVAGYVVEQVSGQPYAEFLQENIFDPLGMENTGYVQDDSGLAVGYEPDSTPSIRLDNSLPYAAAGLYSTVEDLYLYVQALTTGQLLSQESLDQFFGMHEQIDAAGGFSGGYQLPVFYGYGWGIASYNGHREIGHDGWIEGYSGDVRFFPDDDVVMIVLMNRNQPYAPSIGDQILELLFP